MSASTQNTPTGGVPATVRILTVLGWVPLLEVTPGTELAHPSGARSTLLDVRPVGSQPIKTVVLRDTTTIAVGGDQRLRVQAGPRSDAATMDLSGAQMQDLLDEDGALRLLRTAAVEYGSGGQLPVDPWLLGVLLGDGYLRHGSVQLCNQQPAIHAMVREVLPDGVVLRPMIFGAAGTGSSMLVGERRGHNPLQIALAELGLLGKRAHEKFVPDRYLRANAEQRLALLQGALDTDGSIDKLGRIEFSSSSLALAAGIREIVMSLGGRAGWTVKTDVHFTSPRQQERKRARDSYRLTNIRLPEDVAPFRLERKAERVRPGRIARGWNVLSVQDANPEECVQVRVSAPDGGWIGSGHAHYVSPALPEEAEQACA